MLWKIFFWIMAVILTLNHASVYHLADGFSRIWEVIDLAMDIVLLIGLFGFCWERRIFIQLFWKLFFPALLFWLILYTYCIPELKEIAEATPPDWLNTFDMMFSMTVGILVLIAIFLYAFKRQHIWD